MTAVRLEAENDTSGRLDRVRLYHTARTAHLERAREMAPATILYGTRRYDFDADLARVVDARQLGTLAAARLLGRSGVRGLEVNEPASLNSARRTATSLAWLRLRSIIPGRRRPLVVTYAISNSDPFAAARQRGPRAALRHGLDSTLARYVWWECDRVAYGTQAAQATYAQAFGAPRRGQRSAVIPALPTPCSCTVDTTPRSLRVVFLGAFTARKGLPLVVGSWPQVRRAMPGAELVLIGKGQLAPSAENAAAADESIRVVTDPPRALIHTELAQATVLVLPSRPSPTWREQVGLPIVEGLAHGCTVVTTDETGLATWLADHGHRVMPGSGDEHDLAHHVVAALRAPVGREDVRATLPSVDGRLAADEWLFAPVSTDGAGSGADAAR